MDASIQEAYGSYVNNLFSISTCALLLYTTVSKLPQEVEHIWSKRLSFPSLLYIFSRYGALINQGLNVILNVAPISMRSCNILADITTFWFVLIYLGVQGLLNTRAYSLCKGNKCLAGFLLFGFLSGLVLLLIDLIPSNGCIGFTVSDEEKLVDFLFNVSNIYSDLIVFGACTWSLWGTWKLKRETGIQSRNDLVTILLEQSIIRCCFVVVVTVSFTIYAQVKNNLVASVLNIFQNALSAILVADFTLDLRQRNSAAIVAASNISLPSLQFQSVLQHVHQSILVEMGTPEYINVEEGDIDHDDSAVPDDEESPAQDLGVSVLSRVKGEKPCQ